MIIDTGKRAIEASRSGPIATVIQYAGSDKLKGQKILITDGEYASQC